MLELLHTRGGGKHNYKLAGWIFWERESKWHPPHSPHIYSVGGGQNYQMLVIIQYLKFPLSQYSNILPWNNISHLENRRRLNQVNEGHQCSRQLSRQNYFYIDVCFSEFQKHFRWIFPDHHRALHVFEAVLVLPPVLQKIVSKKNPVSDIRNSVILLVMALKAK